MLTQAELVEAKTGFAISLPSTSSGCGLIYALTMEYAGKLFAEGWR